MRNLFVIVITAALVAGCADTILVHPTKNNADFQRDLYECETIANQRVSDMGYSGNVFMVKDETEKCMKIKYGWSRQE